MFQKGDVNGDSTRELWAYLKETTPAGLLGSGIKWNFAKFLVDANGKPFKRYAPTDAPLSLEGDIQELLKGVRNKPMA